MQAGRIVLRHFSAWRVLPADGLEECGQEQLRDAAYAVTEGEYLGLAAYHLADIYYQEKNFSGALPMYRRASVRLKEPKLTNSAKFFVARCLEALGQKLEARSTYEELVNRAQDNPFVDASRLSLAVLLKDAGRTAEALKQVQALARQTENPELKAEATVRSGLWLLDLNQTAKAEEELRKSFEMPGIGSWKNVAQYGLLQLLFDTGKYQELIDQMKSGGTDFGPEIKPQLLILAAKAQAKLGKSEESLAYFDQLTKEFPDSPFTKEASYERLVALYQAEDKSLVPEIDKYVSANPDSAKLDQVRLMKAEVLFKNQDYAAAAPIYEQLNGSRSLTAAMKGEAAFKLGWCYMQTREHERATKAYSGFLEQYPTSKSVPAALVQRGLAHLRTKAFTAALKDFDQLISRHPKAKERELALQQKALILGQQNENEKMAEAFQLLLKDYPDTPAAAAAEANYWIGYVAYGNKDFKTATLHLDRARELDKEQYSERASRLILLSHYQLEDKEAVAREWETYTSTGAKAAILEDVLRWLAESYEKSGEAAERDEARERDLEAAAKYLKLLTQREDGKADDFLRLGRVQLRLGDHKGAVEALNAHLKQTKDPLSRANGLLLLGEAQIGLNEPAAAQKAVDEALQLQPDGIVNGKRAFWPERWRCRATLRKKRQRSSRASQ
jgi:tetratricopeptide (TPR) repeat protein